MSGGPTPGGVTADEWAVRSRLEHGEHIGTAFPSRADAEASSARLGKIWAGGPHGDRPEARTIVRRTRTTYPDRVSEWTEVQP